MILRRLRVNPFGFFPDKEVAFQPGLNVVLGPNEAGKSTLFAAIRSSLLRTRLRKPEFDKLMSRYLPAGGGDVARLELEFTTSEGRWVLRRQWGAGARSELLLPAGGVLADEERIREKLQEALPVRQGTFWKVLMTGQAELGRTVDSLRTDGAGAVSDLAGLLRRTVLETGGISVDEFRTLLAGRLKDTFQHWDARTQGPEDGRGIEKPWKKEVGSILAAWYARETLRAEHVRAVALEKALDEVNARLRAAEQAAAACDAFLTANRRAEQDARNRSRLEADRRALELEQEALLATVRQWPVAQNKALQVRRRLEMLSAARQPLEEEARAARAQEQGRALREKHQRVQRRLARLEEARGAARSGPVLSRKDLEEIRAAAAQAAARAAGRLSMSISGRSDAELIAQQDEGAEEKRRVRRGESLRLQAGGRIRLVTEDLEIEVHSGDAGSQEAARAEAAREALKMLLARHGVQSLEEAEERARITEENAAAVRAQENNLREELAGQSEAELAAAMAALGAEQAVRPLAEVSAALARLQAESEGLEREQRTVAAQLAGWEERHGRLENAVDRLAEVRLRDQEISRQLSESAPVPEGFPSAEEFLRAFEQARDESRRHWEEKARCVDEKHELERRAPEQSSEELAAQLARAEEELAAELCRGRALMRISALTGELLGRSDTAVIDGMRARLEPLIQAMSGGRHAAVALEGSLPRGLAEAGGRVLGWELLSGGMKDTLALALRLAMASFFLQGTDGFLMLDDPLSEMDPERRQAAAAALRSFAEDKQLILFTCHPDVAEILEGYLIRL